eukprot:Selendium_serpulae@DN5956_c0_g1_i1.p1
MPMALRLKRRSFEGPDQLEGPALKKRNVEDSSRSTSPGSSASEPTHNTRSSGKKAPNFGEEDVPPRKSATKRKSVRTIAPRKEEDPAPKAKQRKRVRPIAPRKEDTACERLFALLRTYGEKVSWEEGFLTGFRSECERRMGDNSLPGSTRFNAQLVAWAKALENHDYDEAVYFAPDRQHEDWRYGWAD